MLEVCRLFWLHGLFVVGGVLISLSARTIECVRVIFFSSLMFYIVGSTCT